METTKVTLIKNLFEFDRKNTLGFFDTTNFAYRGYDKDALREWIKKHEGEKQYDWFVVKEQSNDGYKYDVYYAVEIPDLSDTQIGMFTEFVKVQNLQNIQTRTKKIHFWVKFWSILTIVSLVIYAIVLMANS